MTTIAYKDGVLAADSQETNGKMVDNFHCKKIFRLKNGGIIGTSGSSSAGWQLIACLEDYAGGTPPLNRVKCNALFLFKKKVWYYEPYHWYDITKDGHYAIGTGRDFAIAAMDAGASAEEAVQIAANRDIYTGGRVQTLEIS